MSIRKTMAMAAACCLEGAFVSAATNRVEEVTLTEDRTVEVAAGDVYEVDGLYADGDFTLTKTGAGELLVHDVSGAAQAKVDVRAGKFSVCVAEPLIAASAYIHVDAARTNTLTWTVSDGDNLVSTWSDAHGNGRKATSAGKRKPKLVLNAQNGLPVVDLGTLYDGRITSGYGAGFSFARTTSVRDVLLVVADNEEVKTLKDLYYSDVTWNNPSNGSGPFFIGDSEKFRFFRGRLQSNLNPRVGMDGYMSSFVSKGEVMIDGVSVAPLTTNYPDGFHVLGYRTTNSTEACYFGIDRTFTYGGSKFAEALVFTQRISDRSYARMRQWLSRKWMGTPPAASTLAAVTVRQGASVSIGDDVRVLDFKDDNNGVLSVKAGATLTLVSSLDGTVAQESYIHVDAARTNTLTWTVSNGDNLVSTWSDAHGNGRNATSAGKRKPKLVLNAQNGLPVVDLGSLYDGRITSGYGAGFSFARTTSVRDVLLVVADNEEVKTLKDLYYSDVTWNNPSNGSGPFFIGDSEKFQFFRGRLQSNLNPRVGMDGYMSSFVSKGEVTIDGVSVAPLTTNYPDGFHVLGYRTTNVVSASNFGIDRTFTYGGSKFAEAFIFTNRLADADYQAISTALRAKWLKSGDGVSRTIGSLTVEGEATLVAPEANLQIAGTLTLSGTLSTYRVHVGDLVAGANARVDGALVLGDGTLKLALDGNGKPVPLVAGSVTLDGPVTLDADGDLGALIGQKVKLVDTASVSGEIAKWTCAGRVAKVKLSVEADGLYGEFLPIGLTVILK